MGPKALEVLPELLLGLEATGALRNGRVAGGQTASVGHVTCGPLLLLPTTTSAFSASSKARRKWWSPCTPASANATDADEGGSGKET